MVLHPGSANLHAAVSSGASGTGALVLPPVTEAERTLLRPWCVDELS